MATSAPPIRFTSWNPTNEMNVSPEGLHVVALDPDFPFALRFYLFSFHHRVTPTFHDYLEVSYIYQGSGTFSVGNRSFEVAAGDTLVMGNRGFHRLEAHPGESLRVICLFFLPELVYRAGDGAVDFEYLGSFFTASARFSNVIPAADFRHDLLLQRVGAIHEELKAKGDCWRQAVKNQLLEVLLLIERHNRARLPDLGLYDDRRMDIRRLENAFRLIGEGFQRKVHLRQAAASVHMSPSYFCRLFKRITGCTLTEYIFRLRIDKAKELLRQGERTITEIAAETGFESHSYFDRIFHRYTGASPQEYRRRLLSAGAGDPG